MDSKRIYRIADIYLNTPHTPEHPSYGAFLAETLEQWRALLDVGFRFTRVTDLTPETYANSADMLADVRRKQLRVNTAGQCFGPNHPLAATIEHNGEIWLVNEVFRAVHDVNGHGMTECDFETFDGETEAYFNHSLMYSPEAIPALYGETMGQLCHYFSGRGFVPVQLARVIDPKRV